MHKLFRYIFLAGLSLSMTACSFTSGFTSGVTSSQPITNTVSQMDQSEQRAVAQQYLDAMQAGDLSTALSYCTDDFEDGLALKDLNTQLNATLKKYNLNEEYDTQANQMLTLITQKVIQKSNIRSSSQGTAATVQAIDVRTIQNQIKSYVNQYISDHAAEITKSVIANGEQATIQKLVPEAVDSLYQQIQNEVHSLKYQKYTLQFTFKKVGETWKISKTELVKA